MTIDDHPENLIGGRYRLGELLGVGGSASVFAADDTQNSDRRVALKLLHPHLCATEESREAFLREARRAEALRHPNIAAVHSHGLHDTGGVTQAWIALDLVDGTSFGERVARLGPLSVAEAAAVLDGVLAGLGAAHAAGLVHRDVSPANVLLVAHDPPLLASHVRLIDFGLADATGHSVVGGDVLLTSRAPDDAATDLAAADTGVIGNAAFMSPEQAQGRPVRAASDLYQAGALLYFLLTGRPPYPRDSTAQVLEAHVSAPPPVPSVLVADARPLDRVVTRAMTKTPARRFRDAAEFRGALADSLAEAAGARPEAQEPTTDPATRVLRSSTAGQLAYLSPATPVGTGSDPERSQRTPTTPTGLVVLAAAVLIGGLAVWGALAASAVPEPDVQKTPAAVDTATPPATQPVQTTPPVASAPPTEAPSATEILVPTLYGTLADAEQALATLGLGLGTVSRLDSAETAERVLAQNPQPGQPVPAGSTVDVSIASGTNTVPAVTALSVGAATALLESAGFVVNPVGTVSPTSTVSATQPAQGAVLRVGVTVVLLVAPQPSAPPIEPT
ncbi:MAG: PASTA domain-containing protein, partial [Cryobacterium sp.]